MNVVGQVAVIAAVAFAASGATALIRGAPVRQVFCDAAKLKPDEVCLSKVIGEWKGAVVWVDARPRKDWLVDGVKGSYLWNLDPKEDMNAFAAELAPVLLGNPRVVIYCGDESCGVSRQVADRIRELGLGGEIHLLYGGRRALEGSDLLKDSSGAP